ncbi:MAG: glycosyl transferase [Candidatus Aenigmatarchaeota archaeon]|nr:MAG: glycosyl transferase [Candidatus Aenigmarchaeota archaeon]
MKPFVSIIVPTLNEEKYIENCLKSISNQDYDGKYEIIVSDGGSKDKTVKIARKYADKVIICEKRGISYGRNRGAKEAKGDILVFVDADTILLFDTISKLVKPFRKKKVVGSTCPVLPLSPKAGDFLLYWIANQFVSRSLKSSKPQVFGICCAYRKEAFERVNGFDERLKTLEDLDLAERISKLGEIVLVEDTFVLTSPRRIKKWGKTKAARKYLLGYLNYLLTGKGFSAKEYRPVR